MAPSIFSLQSSFSAGMKRDIGRDQMPSGALWNATDYIPDLDAPLSPLAWMHHLFFPIVADLDEVGIQ